MKSRFRLLVDTKRDIEVKALLALGFTCGPQSSSEPCDWDFGSYADASVFFSDDPKGILDSAALRPRASLNTGAQPANRA